MLPLVFDSFSDIPDYHDTNSFEEYWPIILRLPSWSVLSDVLLMVKCELVGDSHREEVAFSSRSISEVHDVNIHIIDINNCLSM